MIVGDPLVFAVESKITKAYEQLGLRALGYFVIHVKGCCYGVNAPDATMLANSFDEVGRRIAECGTHTAAFAMETEAGEIALAFRRAIYGECESGELFFGMSQPQFVDAIYSKQLQWAPDGDEAFDDGSYVLQFDLGDRVRLVAFSGRSEGLVEQASVRDARLPTNDFYGILRSWRDSFDAEWAALPKVSAPHSADKNKR